jgi:murein L,D-transpeptidase YafK
MELMGRGRRALRAAAVAFGVSLLVGLTWEAFPGGYLANRLSARSPDKLTRAQTRATELLRRERITAPPKQLRIVIRKAARILVLHGDDRELFRCRVGLGGVPVGLKERQGDGRTPEGDYRICARNPASQFHLFLGLDYPTPSDAERGYAQGTITVATRQAIQAARTAGRCPPWNTRLGGAVGIHGSGSNWDWTLGCIALDDADIETLWGLCPIGTPVRIDP